MIYLRQVIVARNEVPESLKNLSKILVGRVESWNERQNLLNDFSLFFKAVLRDKNFGSVEIFSTRS